MKMAPYLSSPLKVQIPLFSVHSPFPVLWNLLGMSTCTLHNMTAKQENSHTLLSFKYIYWQIIHIHTSSLHPLWQIQTIVP